MLYNGCGEEWYQSTSVSLCCVSDVKWSCATEVPVPSLVRKTKGIVVRHGTQLNERGD